MPIYKNPVCRKARASDSVYAIAKCIHQTDSYIYPTICPSYDDEGWVSLIRACLSNNKNVFSIDHFFVAEVDERVLAIACVIPAGKAFTFCEGIEPPAALKEGIQRAEKGYFAPLFEDNMRLVGYNIVNLCVDSDHRKRGIGKALLSYVIEACAGSDLYLDVIADNFPAIGLYKSLGFEVVESYHGFSGTDEVLPCLHMKRKGCR